MLHAAAVGRDENLVAAHARPSVFLGSDNLCKVDNLEADALAAVRVGYPSAVVGLELHRVLVAMNVYHLPLAEVGDGERLVLLEALNARLRSEAAEVGSRPLQTHCRSVPAAAEVAHRGIGRCHEVYYGLHGVVLRVLVGAVFHNSLELHSRKVAHLGSYAKLEFGCLASLQCRALLLCQQSVAGVELHAVSRGVLQSDVLHDGRNSLLRSDVHSRRSLQLSHLQVVLKVVRHADVVDIELLVRLDVVGAERQLHEAVSGERREVVAVFGPSVYALAEVYGSHLMVYVVGCEHLEVHVVVDGRMFHPERNDGLHRVVNTNLRRYEQQFARAAHVGVADAAVVAVLRLACGAAPAAFAHSWHGSPLRVGGNRIAERLRRLVRLAGRDGVRSGVGACAGCRYGVHNVDVRALLVAEVADDVGSRTFAVLNVERHPAVALHGVGERLRVYISAVGALGRSLPANDYGAVNRFAERDVLYRRRCVNAYVCFQRRVVALALGVAHNHLVGVESVLRLVVGQDEFLSRLQGLIAACERLQQGAVSVHFGCGERAYSRTADGL